MFSNLLYNFTEEGQQDEFVLPVILLYFKEKKTFLFPILIHTQVLDYVSNFIFQSFFVHL